MQRFLLVLSIICFYYINICAENIKVPVYEAFSQGFESNTDGWITFVSPSTNYGSILKVSSGTDGITSKSGSNHAKVGHFSSGPFTRFDKYRSKWPDGGWKAKLDIYLDPSWAASSGFDLSVATNKQDGNHLSDFIFHVCKDLSTGSLLVGGSNNTNFAVRQDLETINHYTVTSAGWYIFEFVFRNQSGQLAVDLNLRNSSNTLLWTETRTSTSDLIASVVGGNRYMWFTFISVPGDLHIDNTELIIYHNTIQSAINAANAGDEIIVDDGTYNENVLLNKNITLKSVNGYSSTTIVGSSGSSLGTIQVTTGSNGVQIGDLNQGFTIIGFDGQAGLETACIYFQGTHTNPVVKGNKIVANGEAGLLTEYNNTVDGLLVDNNIFTGKTFVVKYPAGDGFNSQFTLLNVPRQLVTISVGTVNATFTNNLVEGITGGCSNIANDGSTSTWHQQGNTQVTIDATNATISNNTFKGITTRYAHALRARGTGTVNISSNIFDGYNPYHFFANTGNTGRASAVLNNNTFTDPTPTIYQESIISSQFYFNPLNCNCNNAVVDDDWISKSNGDIVYAKSEAWIFGSNAFATIQEGVDAVCGSTVYVLAGTYEEQVEITKNNLTLQGVGSSTIIKSPITLSKSFSSGSSDNKPIVFINGATGVTIKDLLVDGFGRGNSNYRFVGIGFYNGDGLVENVEVKNIQETPFNGNQHGVGIYSYYNNSEGNPNFEIANCKISEFQKNAMALISLTGPLDVDVHDNVITGKGATQVTAQNGIQIWSSGGYGKIYNNTINGIEWIYPGTGTNWVATSILNFYSDLDIYDNVINNGHMGIYSIGSSTDIYNNELYISNSGSYAYGIVVSDPPHAVPSPIDNIDLGINKQNKEKILANLTFSVNNNIVILNSGSNDNSTYGIEADAGFDENGISFSAKNNYVSGFDVGFEIFQCISGCHTTPGKFIAAEINFNDISGNKTYGMETNVDYLTINAEYNWWGDCSGPKDISGTIEVPDNAEPELVNQMKNADGLGNGVTNNIDYYPWLGNSFGDAALWLSPITAKRIGDERLANWLSMDCGNRKAVQGATKRQPIYSDGWVKFESDFGASKYGYSDVMEVQRYGDITATDGGSIDKWHPSNQKKNLFVTFKTGTSVDDEAEPPVYYRDGRQCIFEAGGPLSGYNLYLVGGKLVFGMWNRFESKYTILENSSLYPLTTEKTYYGHLYYDGDKFIANVSDGTSLSPSPEITFSGLSQDAEDKTGIGGAARTRYHDYSVGSTYSDEFDGLLGDIIIYCGNDFSNTTGVSTYLNARYGVPNITTPRITADDWKIIAEYDRTGENNISSAYPNPFDSKTSIGINLLSEQNINIELLDLMGRKVAVVFNGKLAAGIHDIEIDGTGLSNGIYFVKVAGETFTQTTQVILNK